MKNKLTLRLYRNKACEFCWSLKAGNGERIAQGEGYRRRIDLESTLVLIFMGRYLAHGSKKNPNRAVLSHRHLPQGRDEALTTRPGPWLVTFACDAPGSQPGRDGR